MCLQVLFCSLRSKRNKKNTKRIFVHSREAGWHSMCSLTLQWGNLEMCHYQSDLAWWQVAVLR